MRGSVLFVTFLFFVLSPLLAKKKPRTGKEALFGKEYATYQITSNELSGACFYLVSGHGGPDPGAIGIYQGRQLHEDEYAYDIILRLARELLSRGAKVHIIIQDKKDGIRDGHVLANSKRETCMGDPIPLNQVARLKQRCDWVNKLYRKDKSNYKRAINIAVPFFFMWTVAVRDSRQMCFFITLLKVRRVGGWPITCTVPLIGNMTSISQTVAFAER